VNRQAKTTTVNRKPKVDRGGKSPRRFWLLLLPLGIGVVLWFGYSHFVRRSPQFPVAPNHSDPIVAAQIAQSFDAVQKSPRSGQSWGKLGMVLHAYLFDEEAWVCFANAQRFDHEEPRWPYFEGIILLTSNPETALPRLARAVELCPSTPDTPRLQYARALLEHGYMSHAESHFRELLARNPSHPPALLGLARISDARGDWPAATQLLKRCLESPFAARNAYLLLASVQSKVGNASAAQTASDIARNLPSDQSWPEPFTDEIRRLQMGLDQLVSQADRALKEKRHADAELVVARLVKDHGGSPQAWLLAGRLHLERKDCAGAEQALRRHLQLDSQSVNGHARLGMALLCQERYADAVPVLEKAVQIKPDLAEGHFNLGFARARAGQGTSALPALREAIRCSPSFMEPYVILADLLGQMGEANEALALLQRAQQINPNDPRLPVLRDRITARPD
jgi:tetratricopeptide (TPR) repeat protein